MLLSELFRRNPTGELPQWASDILAATPARGNGLNRWFLKAAIALRRCGRSEHDIRAALSAATADQPVRHGEIERAVERSLGFMSDSPTPAPRHTWSTENETLRSNVIEQAGGAEVGDLWERSPYRLVDDGPGAKGIIDMLFPGDPLLCCAATLPTAHTAPREWWRGRLDEDAVHCSESHVFTNWADTGRQALGAMPRQYRTTAVSRGRARLRHTGRAGCHPTAPCRARPFSNGVDQREQELARLVFMQGRD